jgi:hypothetical protein
MVSSKIVNVLLLLNRHSKEVRSCHVSSSSVVPSTKNMHADSVISLNPQDKLESSPCLYARKRIR